MKKNLIIFIILIAPNFISYSQTGLLVNEALSTNQSTYPQNGEYYDWVEIYNPTGSAINISGYYVTDDVANKTKHKLPNSASLNIPSNGYLVLFASSLPALGAQHLNFGLSSDGEQVLLYDPLGTTLIDSLVFPKLKADVSFGKLPDGSRKYFWPSSPNATNNAANSFVGILTEPIFSKNGGFYNSSFNLSITSTEQAQIIYSTDGTDPNPENLTVQSYEYKTQYPFLVGQPFGQFSSNTFQAYTYAAPIPIVDRTNQLNKIAKITTGINFVSPDYPLFKGTVVKARATKLGFLSSDVVEQSYFINSTGLNPYNLPVISLGVQENKLFDYQIGGYIPGVDMDNYRTQNPSGTDWGTYGVGNYFRDYIEIGSTLNYIPINSTALRQNIGVKIHGNMSRHIVLKSLRIYARSIYGKDKIDYKFFDYVPTTSFKRLLFRNSGGDFNYTMFRDGIIQKALSHLDFESQSYQPAVSFINGEFWGILNIRERLDDDYYSQRYGFSKDSLDVLENNQILEYGSPNHFLETQNFIKNNNIGNTNNYNEVLKRIDLDNMIDYYSAELYVSNQDWPSNNIQYWRMAKAFDANAPKGKDGRWRWSMYDLDSSTGSPDLPFSSPSYNNLDPFFTSTEVNAVIFTKLFENNSVKNKFLIRNADLLNSTYKPDRIVRMVNETKGKLKNVILDHIKRWREPLAYNWTDPIDTSYWVARTNQMKTFINERPAYFKTFLQNKFGITGDFQLTLLSDINKGAIKVNTIVIEPTTPGIPANTYPWVGTYFDNLETRLEAIPKKGYKFVHWIKNGVINTTPILVFTTNSNTTVEAVFEMYFVSENPTPQAFNLANCNYSFSEWPANAASGTFPASTKFVYFNQQDPTPSAEIENFTNGVYNLSSRTRINGLGNNGVSFINTNNTAGNPGYPGLKLGGMLLALNTENLDKISVSWKGRTIVSNSKEYRIRLQYRYGDIWPFQDLLDENGQIIEYVKQANGGNKEFGPINLPPSIISKNYVQLLWRYYFTGNVANVNSDTRDQLAIDDIVIKTEKLVPESSSINSIEGVSVIKSFENVLQNQQRIYTAKDYIEFLPNFNTNTPIQLDAKIGGCPN